MIRLTLNCEQCNGELTVCLSQPMPDIPHEGVGSCPHCGAMYEVNHVNIGRYDVCLQNEARPLSDLSVVVSPGEGVRSPRFTLIDKTQHSAIASACVSEAWDWLKMAEALIMDVEYGPYDTPEAMAEAHRKE